MLPYFVSSHFIVPKTPMGLKIFFLFNPHLRTFFHGFSKRTREMEGERDIDWLPLACAPSGD